MAGGPLKATGAALLLAALTGCGGAVTPSAPQVGPSAPAAAASAAPLPRTSASVAPVRPSAVPGATASAAPSAVPALSEAASLAVKAYAGVKDYTCQIRGFTKGSAGFQALFVSYVFARPGSIKLQVIAADDADLQGAAITYTGGDKITYRGRVGFAHEFPQQLDLQDPRALTGLGNTVAETGLGWMVGRLTQPGAEVKPLTREGQTAVVGRPVAWVQVTSPALAAAGHVREVLALDKETHLPISHEIYNASGEQVYQAALQNLRLNPGVPADAFKP